jgi:hypothetical protein
MRRGSTGGPATRLVLIATVFVMFMFDRPISEEPADPAS